MMMSLFHIKIKLLYHVYDVIRIKFHESYAMIRIVWLASS